MIYCVGDLINSHPFEQANVLVRGLNDALMNAVNKTTVAPDQHPQASIQLMDTIQHGCQALSHCYLRMRHVRTPKVDW